MSAGVLLGYLLGSIPFAVIVARTGGAGDLRTIGSGNPGATNVARLMGPAAGVLVALLDIGKGALSVLAARQLSSDPAAPAVAGLAAIIGHVYPVWAGFRGGKGVATAAGVFAVLSPLALVPAVIVFALVAAATRYVSAASVAASLSLLPAEYLLERERSIVVIAVLTAVVIVVRHRENLARIRAGSEPRFAVRTQSETAMRAARRDLTDTGAAP
jgi:glycerol-3-phosphate acyltransferase PlsY